MDPGQRSQWPALWWQERCRAVALPTATQSQESNPDLSDDKVRVSLHLAIYSLLRQLVTNHLLSVRPVPSAEDIAMSKTDTALLEFTVMTNKNTNKCIYHYNQDAKGTIA